MPSPLHITSLSHDQSDPRAGKLFAKQGAVGTRGEVFFLSSERDLKVCWFVGATLDVSYVYCCDKQSPEVRIWIAFEEGLARAVFDVYQPVLMRATAVSMLVSSIYSPGGGGGGFCRAAHQVQHIVSLLLE